MWHYDVDPSTKAITMIGERYTVSSSVVYDGLTAFDSIPLEIFPLDAKNRFGARFLMNFPEFKNILWANGEDFQKLVISRDASSPSSLSNFGSCF